MLKKTTYENLNGQSGKAALEIAIHPLKSDRIVVFYAGCGTGVNGFLRRYKRIANRLVREGVGAVVHASDPSGSVQDLRKVLDTVLARAEEITGTASPEIYLQGDSAGSNAAAEIAAEYNISRLLLMAPTEDKDLSKFKGDLLVAVGAKDEAALRPARRIHDSAGNAAHRELLVIPRAKHGFHGPAANLRFSRAFKWAFTGDPGSGSQTVL